MRGAGLIDVGIAQGAVDSPLVKEQARKGLVGFLREQIVEAEWKITRAKSEIGAYQAAIKAIEREAKTPVKSKRR